MTTLTPSSQFVMSTELECLTCALHANADIGATFGRFFDIMKTLAPTLPAVSGIFNAYGRVYVDVGHIELAMAECDSPYLLASVVERQQTLVSQAIERLSQEGHRFLLANNNHSGLLQPGCPIWGSHENYLTEQHATTFTEAILPFLVTRLYAGAGGIEYPSGNYLLGVRPVRMELATGGGTTESRAIHSTARDEHHMGGQPQRFRYHLILGDGHRSQFNLALQFGATALALKALFFVPGFREEVARLDLPRHGDWVATLHEFNRLATPQRELAIDPQVIRVQRKYLEGARRYVDLLPGGPPEWVPRTLHDWEQTLAALERMDRPWLSQRLDAFAKYEFYTAMLAENGKTWRELPAAQGLFSELALLDHSYHEFSNPRSVFRRLERSNLLAHRVAEYVAPGQEPEPFVPETTTRAKLRAEFIKNNAQRGSFVVDWSYIEDVLERRSVRISDPFARELEPWQTHGAPAAANPLFTPPAPNPASVVYQEALQRYDRGEYELAHTLLSRPESQAAAVDPSHRERLLQLKVWVASRRGQVDADPLLEQLYAGRSLSISALSDYCCAARFRGLVPHAAMDRWIPQGLSLLAGTDQVSFDPHGAPAFRDHAAAHWRAQGRYEDARGLLERACEPSRLRSAQGRSQARLLATLADICRVLGARDQATDLLRRAMEIQEASRYEGDLAEFTLLGMARLAEPQEWAMVHLDNAKQRLRRLSHFMGLARVLLLEARVSGDARIAAENRERFVALRQQLPALAQCPRATLVLDQWDAWQSGRRPQAAHEMRDHYWDV